MRKLQKPLAGPLFLVAGSVGLLILLSACGGGEQASTTSPGKGTTEAVRATAAPTPTPISPPPASSLLPDSRTKVLEEGGEAVYVRTEIEDLARDLDGDGAPELIVASLWEAEESFSATVPFFAQFDFFVYREGGWQSELSREREWGKVWRLNLEDINDGPGLEVVWQVLIGAAQCDFTELLIAGLHGQNLDVYFDAPLGSLSCSQAEIEYNRLVSRQRLPSFDPERLRLSDGAREVAQNEETLSWLIESGSGPRCCPVGEDIETYAWDGESRTYKQASRERKFYRLVTWEELGLTREQLLEDNTLLPQARWTHDKVVAIADWE